jgi:acyl transferase domain-containing protein/NAD(P)-dependent dehydrogenase (short-subunit alcohol dehydrogenase family)
MNASISTEKDLGITFAFPGQGSYSYEVLRELYFSFPQTVPYFQAANEISNELLKADFLSLVTSDSPKEHEQRLSACRDLDQIGIYLAEVLIARLLIEAGVQPTLLLGHSFGELAALATGGVYSIETGVRIVCHRVLALQANSKAGAMAAVSCDLESAKQYLETAQTSAVEISVINKLRQTVLSGPAQELEQLQQVLNQQGVSLTLLKSRYPYHSSLLHDAVAPFRDALQSFTFRPARIPVYLCMEGILHSPGTDLPEALSSQFVRPLNFQHVVKTICAAGYRSFIECGVGNIVTKLIDQNAVDYAGSIRTIGVTTADGTVSGGLSRIRSEGFAEARDDSRTRAIAGQLLEDMSSAVKNMSQLVENARQLVGPVSSESNDDVKPEVIAVAAPETRIELKTPSAAPHTNGHKPKLTVTEKCDEVPIAIVSLGCVLPAANDPNEYWSNILNGVSGISRLTDNDPAAAQDFLVGNGDAQTVVPDKSYTLLHGSIFNPPYDAKLLAHAYTPEEFATLTNGQKLLALALAQSLSNIQSKLSLDRVQCILGATADGSKEYDDAVFAESVQNLLKTLDEPEELRRAFGSSLEKICGYKPGDADQLSQHKIYQAVVEHVAGQRLPTYVVDTACSSSLYSIYLGMRGLQDQECDLVLAGGVFAPGPANNTLFAQFKGLAQRESRPFDASAQGVVFGDGAGIIALKRLPDALNDGDHVLAVIRGIGLSSDGRSPSINVPQSKGQSIAIKKAYNSSQLDMNTIQYVEAHATATLVGDAVEFSALKETLQREPTLPPIELGSVKALVGHTGWVAGVASIIKICKAFEAKVIPRQYNYVSPSAEIDLANSQFVITETSHPWPENPFSCPRRAAINGFGFGGTNAHVVIEQFDENYHRELSSQLAPSTITNSELALIGISSLFPNPDGSLNAEPSSQSNFDRKSLRLPPKKMLLPDVTEHMDPSQFLAAQAAAKVLAALPASWEQFKASTGVVLGLESKTERGMRANERVFTDRLRRQVSEASLNGSLTSGDVNRLVEKLIDQIRTRNVPSGPYTLPGLMPNVTAGRITNMFDLNGPNIVVDLGPHSLLQSLFVARQLLAHKECDIVLAGGINANTTNHDDQSEAVLLLALTTTKIAEKKSLPVLATLNFVASKSDSTFAEVTATARNFKGAQGAAELLAAINQSQQQNARRTFQQVDTPFAGRHIVIDSPTANRSEANSSRSHAYVQGTPIRYCSPRLVSAAVKGDAKSLQHKRILFLTDQPELWSRLESSGALAALDYNVVCPLSSDLARSLPLDLRSEESIQNSLPGLAQVEFDCVIAIKNLEESSKDSLLLEGTTNVQLLDTLFAVCRSIYERVKEKGIPVVALCLSAYRNGQLDPYTGLVAGFMKSLARELDGPVCRAINTDETNFFKALHHVEVELGQASREVEVCYREGTRSTFALAPVEKLARDTKSYLDSESVVIATGGARGVTAVLIEELLQKHGCRVIALGRTDTSSTPAHVLEMDEETLKSYEPQFYKEEMAKNSGKKITALKREYLSFRAAHEVHHLTKQLQAISSKYEYISVDINNAAAMEQIVADVYRKYGRVDLVLHGAGIQISKALPKKSIADFRKIVGTKLDGLSHLYKACKKYQTDKPVHFHILTSAFSYMGNDGQPDYGAANEAMNRIAECMNASADDAHWSSMAWLGWAGIGMTRDSEFAALAASRRLRGVTKDEGQQIFTELMAGSPATPINVLLADGEIDFYKVALADAAPATKTKPDSCVIEREVSVANAPYLVNHLVDGVPTLPGAFVIAVFAEAALHLRPKLKIISFEQAGFRRFTKVYESRKTKLRIEAGIVSEDERETLIQVSIRSDFVHASGVTLQKDLLQHEILVRMAPALPEIPRRVTNGNGGRPSRDPYVLTGSPVLLSGPFDAMRNLTIGPEHRHADFKLDDISSTEQRALWSKIVLMDSLWRFGVIQGEADNSMPVFVPEACEIMKIYFDFADFDVSKVQGPLTFSGANPTPDGMRLHMGPVAAIDQDGNALVVVERGVCLRFGEVRNVRALYNQAASSAS